MRSASPESPLGNGAAFTLLSNDPTPEEMARWEQAIKSRTHDELTGRQILPKGKLVHDKYYKGRCRNATIARWNSDQLCFYHWRVKFERTYIQTIKYPTDEMEPWWDVFDVVEELPDCKFEIPFDCEAVFSGNRDDLFEFAEEMWESVGSAG